MAVKSFLIVEVQPESVVEQEALGSKRKFWYRCEDGSQWLFKYPREGTGEHWAEKIASEIAKHLQIPRATVELATFQDVYGSATLSFATKGRELVHGNQLLAGKVLGYDPQRRFRNSDHTLANVWRALEGAFQRTRASDIAKRRFAEYLVLDAMIGNTDRHHENWGLLSRRVGDRWKSFIAPTYDHASSLGRELADCGLGKSRAELLARNRVSDYAQKARGGIYWSAEDTRGLSPLELVRRARTDFPDLFRSASAKLAKLHPDILAGVIARIPEKWMTPMAPRFAFALTSYNLEQLQRLLR